MSKVEILVADFNGKENKFPVPRNIVFRVNSVQSPCLKITNLGSMKFRFHSLAFTISPEEGLSLGTELHSHNEPGIHGEGGKSVYSLCGDVLGGIGPCTDPKLPASTSYLKICMHHRNIQTLVCSMLGMVTSGCSH